MATARQNPSCLTEQPRSAAHTTITSDLASKRDPSTTPRSGQPRSSYLSRGGPKRTSSPTACSAEYPGHRLCIQTRCRPLLCLLPPCRHCTLPAIATASPDPSSTPTSLQAALNRNAAHGRVMSLWIILAAICTGVASNAAAGSGRPRQLELHIFQYGPANGTCIGPGVGQGGKGYRVRGGDDDAEGHGDDGGGAGQDTGQLHPHTQGLPADVSASPGRRKDRVSVDLDSVGSLIEGRVVLRLTRYRCNPCRRYSSSSSSPATGSTIYVT